MRSNQPDQGPTVRLVALADADNEIVDYACRSRTLFVSWPLDAELFWKAARRLTAAAEPTA